MDSTFSYEHDIPVFGFLMETPAEFGALYQQNL